MFRGTQIQINATLSPSNPSYTYNWQNLNTGQLLQSELDSFLIITVYQTVLIEVTVYNGIVLETRNTIQITVINSPNPGTDGDLLLCNQTGVIDLFTILQGNPDSGGIWSPTLASGNGNFTVGIDPPGEYTYILNSNDPYPNAESKITVRECNSEDYDNDGVLNLFDLDDDNDGVLDVDENLSCASGSLTELNPLVDIDFGRGGSTTDSNVKGHTYTSTWPNDGFYNVASSKFMAYSTSFIPWFIITDANPNQHVDGSGDVNGRYLAINVADNFYGQVLYEVKDIPVEIGTEYNFGIDLVGLCNRGCGDIPIIQLEIIDQSLPSGSSPIFSTSSSAIGLQNNDIWNRLSININAPSSTYLSLRITNYQTQGGDGNDLGIDNIRFTPLGCDFDLDGIPNYLDLDSDNDGIYDIIEAGNPAVIDTNFDGIADGPVDANGVPISANGGTNAINTDVSTFPNYLDIDSDNDAIQDNIEGQGTFSYLAPSGIDLDKNGVDDIYDMANYPITPEDTDGDGIPDYLDLNSDNDCLDDTIEAYDFNQDGIIDIFPSGFDSDIDGLDNNFDNVLLTSSNSVTNPSNGNEMPTSLPNNHTPGNDVDFREEFVELFESFNLCSGSTTINLFDSLVITAYSGGTWTGPSILTGGELGTFDSAVNTSGVYTYTLPQIGTCPERKGEINVILGVNPDTGINNTVTLCDTDNAINLFDSLGGSPNIGGVWSPALASGSGILDPSVDPSGTYTYSITIPSCASSSSSNIRVIINEAPDAGNDSNLEICESGFPIDLYTLLEGTPDVGGIWSPTLNSGTGLFDPALDSGGNYTYTVSGTTPCTDDTSQVNVVIYDSLTVSQPQDLRVCDSGNDDVEVFNLEEQSSIISNNTGYIVTYHSTQNDADSGINPLVSPYTNTDNPQTIYTRVTDQNNCYFTNINFDLIIDGVIANDYNYTLCDDNMEFDGDTSNDSTVFNLNSSNTFILGSQDPSNHIITHHLTQQDANNNVNHMSSPYENTSNSQTIYARVTDNTTLCFETSEVTLQVNPMPILDLPDLYTICIDESGTLISPPPIIDTELTTTQYIFQWFLNGVLLSDEINASIIASQIGVYNVIVTNSNTGCSTLANDPNTFTEVVQRGISTLNVEQTSHTFIEDNTILATAFNENSNTLFEFSIDGRNWVNNIPNNNTYIFYDVEAGEHEIFAREINTNSCGDISATIFVIDYMKFFTPNGDGYHDKWNILGIENIPDAKILIFNRFGKLLKQLSPTNNGWNGIYNGKVLTSNDYWFTLDYRDPNTGQEKQFKSHFTLKN